MRTFLLCMKNSMSLADDFLFNFVFFSYKQRVISKYLACICLKQIIETVYNLFNYETLFVENSNTYTQRF